MNQAEHELKRLLIEALGQAAGEAAFTSLQAPAGGPDAVDTLDADYTLTVAGEKVLEVTAPTTGLYRLDLIGAGVVFYGDNGNYNGDAQGYAIADFVGENDQTDFTSNLKTVPNDVTGMVIFERDHATKVYAGNIELFWRAATRQDEMYDGTVLGHYQSQVVYLEAGGKVEVYLRNNASIIDGGYHKFLAGSKLQLTKLGEWTYPAAV